MRETATPPTQDYSIASAAHATHVAVDPTARPAIFTNNTHPAPVTAKAPVSGAPSVGQAGPGPAGPRVQYEEAEWDP